MKRVAVLLVALAASVSTLAGCYGKFALVRKIYQVNGQVGDKYLRSLLTWVFVLIPVYQLSALVDFIVFNTIEFWSGRNPIAVGEKTLHYAEAGQNFTIHAKKEGESVSYTIDRYAGDRYVDTMTIAWDLRSGDSRATLREFARTTEYYAWREDGGVKVRLLDGGLPESLERVALYR